MTQFLWVQASDREEVVTPLMLDGTYLSRNYATLGPMIRQPPCDFIGLLFFCLASSTERLSFFFPSFSSSLSIDYNHYDYKKEREKSIRNWRTREIYSFGPMELSIVSFLLRSSIRILNFYWNTRKITIKRNESVKGFHLNIDSNARTWRKKVLNKRSNSWICTKSLVIINSLSTKDYISLNQNL